MQYVSLTQSQYAIVDDEDYQLLTKIGKWYFSMGYAMKKETGVENRKTILMHRFIWEYYNGPIYNELEIDHINRNRLDNQKSNLRLVTCQQNIVNSGRRKKNTTSIYKGVTKHKYGWYARIRHGEKTTCLGVFKTERLAAIAYDMKNRQLNGGFASLNIINPLIEETIEVIKFLTLKNRI